MGVVIIEMHLVVVYSQILMIGDSPVCPDARSYPFSLIAMTLIGLECPKKNLYFWVLISIEINIPPDEKITVFSPPILDHFNPASVL